MIPCTRVFGLRVGNEVAVRLGRLQNAVFSVVRSSLFLKMHIFIIMHVTCYRLAAALHHAPFTLVVLAVSLLHNQKLIPRSAFSPHALPVACNTNLR